MIFEFKNIGAIKEATVEVGNLTLICGKNNTGKTYLTYGVYGFLKNSLDNFLLDLNLETINNIKDVFLSAIEPSSNKQFINFDLEYIFECIIEMLNLDYAYRFHEVFSANEKTFENAGINFILSDNFLNLFKEYLKKIGVEILKTSDNKNIVIKPTENPLYEEDKIYSELEINFLNFLKNYFSNHFILSAQRDSIQLFYKELDKHRSDLIERLRKTKNLDLLEKETARFALPIEDNIDFARDLTTQVIKDNSFLQEENPEILEYIEKMLNVDYVINNGTLSITDKKTGKAIPPYMASTSVRALSDLHFFLKHKAHKGSMLMIDEPELNLHPENQIKMARLLVKLVNAGIKVWITTHSDYIVKEINNLLMLSGDFPEKAELMQEYNYTENDLLKKEDLRAYITVPMEGGYTVKRVETDTYGMVESGFDEAIVQINEISNRIFTAINNQQDETTQPTQS